MPPKRYKAKMSDEMVLQLFDEGKYVWDGKHVVSARTGKPLFAWCGDRSTLPYCRLFRTENGTAYARSIGLHQVAWILGSRDEIPEGWEIHHFDEDQRNNDYANLICCHPEDHKKFHNREVEVPF